MPARIRATFGGGMALPDDKLAPLKKHKKEDPPPTATFGGMALSKGKRYPLYKTGKIKQPAVIKRLSPSLWLTGANIPLSKYITREKTRKIQHLTHLFSRR